MSTGPATEAAEKVGAEPTFEAAKKELDAIVARLEKGELPLEEIFSAYKRGVELSLLCGRQLDEFEKRVEQLTMDASGRPALTPFEAV